MSLGKQAVSVAIKQVGAKENPLGSNWGKPIQDYLKSVGINFPASWCMAFVYWCFEQIAMAKIHSLKVVGCCIVGITQSLIELLENQKRATSS